MGVTVEMNKAINDSEQAFGEMLHLNAQVSADCRHAALAENVARAARTSLVV